MKKQIFNKKNLIIGILILTLLTLSGVLIFNKIITMHLQGQNGKGELARAMTYDELTDDDEKTQSDFVKFSAFFLRDLDSDGYAEKIKGTCKPTGGSDTLYMSLNVLTEGIFKNGKIEIQGTNMYFQTALVDDEVINGNYINSNTTEINLKDVNVGTQKLIFGQARSGIYDNAYDKTLAISNDTSKYSGINKIILTGIHIANDGTETEIQKEVELEVDWYNTPQSEIPYRYADNKDNIYQNYSNNNIIDLINNKIDISFKIVTQETKNLQNLSKSYIVGEIPQFNGYDPISVEVTGSRVTYTYDETTRIFSAQREARLDLEGRILTEAYTGKYKTNRYNEYKLKVSYPLEAYTTLGIDTINLAIPVKAWYEGFNNPNDEFDNPVKSNVSEEIISVVYEFGGGDVVGFDLSVGKWVPQPYDAWVISKYRAEQVYKGEISSSTDIYDSYTVMWSASRGNDGEIASIRLKEQANNYTDKFLNADNEYTDMEAFVENRGIYFVGAGNMLGKDGYIDVINDETDELIHRFTEEDWNFFSADYPYEYEEPIKHIRIETSATNKNSSIYVYNIKGLNCTEISNRYTEEEFEKFKLIYSYLNASIKYSETDEYKEVKNDLERANYDSTKSVVELGISENVYSTQEIKENVILNINARNLTYNTAGWIDGEFLVKFPEEILDVKINNININNNDVSIIGYSLEEKDDGNYLRIITENITTYEEFYNIEVNLNITPDPRCLSANKNIELYAINSYCTNYLDGSSDIYDLDGDENIDEIVGKVSKSITLVGPTSILTMEKATEYNENHDELDTAISPQVAIIDKTQADKTAKIMPVIINNYSGNVSEIKIVGKIPFEGNSFILNSEIDMKSTYTAIMIEGIKIPETLKEYAKIYYSEKEVVNEDLNDESNNWIPEENITDFSSIKSYLIDLGNYSMQKGEEQAFSYKIEIPNDVNYNEVSYSTHAVYFALETTEGKLRDETETNKLGFMIARKYALEINKTKMGSDIKVQGAAFSIEEIGTQNRKILSTDADGKIEITDLYVEKEYVIKEVKAPYNYIRNEEEIKIKGIVVDGELVVNKIIETEITNTEEDSDTTVEITEESIEIKDGNYGKTALLAIENEPKYTLRITKYEKDTDQTIQGITFSLYGKGMPNNGKYVTTNSEGKLTITGLYPGEVYWLYETNCKGYEYEYYSRSFVANWNENNELELVVNYGTFRDEPIIDSTTEHQPIVDLAIENVKLREYSFELVKYEKDSTQTIENAKFYINGSWVYGEYVTDGNGKLKVPTLYEGRTYYIYERVAPDGYTLNENTIGFVGNFNENGELEITIRYGELSPIHGEEWTENGNVYDSTGTLINGKKVSIGQDENGKYVFSLGYDNEPLFRLTKKDGETYEPLDGAKFAIYELDSYNEEMLAYDANGYVVGEFKESDTVVKFNSDNAYEETTEEDIYKWYENEEGIWCSGNAGVHNSTSTLKSDEFEINKPQLLEFQYAVSSEYSDGLYYIIKNTETGETIGGTSTKIGGYAYNEYTDLYYLIRRIYLDPGKYTIEFVFSKNAEDTNNVGLDKGFVKEVKIGEYLINTNELGRISLGLSDGTYKIVEVEAPEGYVLAENIEDRTYYMSIGKLKPEQRSVEKSEELTLETDGNITFTEQTATSDGGIVVAGTVTGNVKFNPEQTVSGEEIVLNSVNDGVIIKYNKDNKIQWARRMYGSAAITPRKIIEVEDEYICLIDAQSLNIPPEATNTGDWIKIYTRNYDAMLLKYTNDGLVEWGVTTYGWCADYIRDIEFTDDGGFIMVGYWNGTDLNFLEDKTASGEMISLVNSENQSRNAGMFVKYNKDHLVEWATSISGTGANYINSIDKVINENGETEYLCVVDIAGATLLEEQIAEGTDVIYESGAYKGLLKFNSEGKINKFYDSFSNAPIARINEDGSALLMQKNRIVEYDTTGEIVTNISLSTLPVTITDIAECEDGGYFVVGQHNGNYTIPADLTVSGETIPLTTTGKNDFVMIKFTNDFKIETAKMFGTSADDSYIRIEKLINNQFSVTMNFVGTYVNEETIVSGATIFIMDDINTIAFIDSKPQETSFFFDAITTSDNGKIGVGYYKGIQKLNVNGEDISINSKGGYDALLLKYDENNSIEWHIAFGGGEEDKFTGVAEVNGNYVVSGIYYGQIEIPAEFTENNTAITLENKGINTYNSVILEINTDGKIVNYLNLNSAGAIKIDGLKTATGTEYFVYGSLGNSITLENVDGTETIIATTGWDDALVLKFDSTHKLITYTSINSGNNTSEYFNSMTITKDEGVALTGYINSEITVTTKYGETITLTNSWQDMIVVKYDHELNLEWARHPGPRVSYQGTRYCSTTEDGGLFVTGDLYYGNVSIPAELTVAGKAIEFSRRNDAWCGFVIKYNADGLAEWAFRVSAAANMRNLRPIGYGDGAIILMSGDGGIQLDASIMENGVRYYDSNSTSPTYILKCNGEGLIQYAKRIDGAPMRGGLILEDNKYMIFGGASANGVTSASIMTIDEYMVFAEVPVQQTIEIENEKIQFEITTNVIEKENGEKGGTISGEDLQPYEVVKYGENTKNEIVILPNADYKILNIKVNNEDFQFMANEDETYSMSFENLKEDKHIDVEFSSTVSDVIVHHYINGTEEKVAEDEFYHGEIGTYYTTAPKMDIEDYYVLVDKLPENASGVYSEENQEITYYYESRKAKLTVHHYLEGTTEEISSQGYSKELSKGETYTTEVATDLEEKYELVYEPANKEGTITEDTEVNYYYRIKTYNITTKVDGEGGTISGNGLNPYEEVEYSETSQKDIIVEPSEGYIVSEITVNGEKIEFIEDENRIVTLEKFIDVKENKDITVKFEKISGKVIVHHYIEGTTEKVPSNIDGKVVEDEIKEGPIGEAYATKPNDNIAVYYRYSSCSTIDTSGKYTENVREITYYYVINSYEYTIEYYYDGIIDDTKTEKDIVDYGTIIDEYTDNNIPGYKVNLEENLPLKVTEKAENNIIRIYYEKAEIIYRVEYYYDGLIDESKTEELEATYESEVTEYKDKVIDGYKLSKVENNPLKITLNENDNIMKIYYEKDEFEYRVEYYYDGVIDNSKTEKNNAIYESEVVNYEDKVIDGYKFSTVENIPLKITSDEAENVIKVYYIKDVFGYTVEYYYNGIIDNANTEVVEALYGEVVENYVEKLLDGFKLEKEENLPLTISNNIYDNVIKVYYVTDDSQTKELSYTVEYYKDGVLTDAEVEKTTVQVLQPDTMSVAKDKINVTDKYDGYKFIGTDPEEIPDTVSNGDIIKVNYEKDTFEYTVEYYFDNVKDESKTETSAALFEEVINTYTDKVEVGYKFDKVEGTPLTITSNPANNIIKVYYVIDEAQTKEIKYTVEYYKDGVLADTEEFTEVVQVFAEETLTVRKDEINVADKYDGYKFVGTDPEEIPDTVSNGNIIKVNYEKDTFEYTVEYYFDNVKDESKTETSAALFEEVINTYTDKVEVGYKFDRVEGTPLTITSNPANNVIKVFYVKGQFEYKVEYYYAGEIDDSKTDILVANCGDTIENVENKVIEGYRFDRAENFPLVVSENAENNVIKIYYIIDNDNTKEISYTVEYYKDGVLDEESTQVVRKTVQVLQPDVLDVNKADINLVDKYDGYKLDAANTQEVPNIVNDGEVIKVYYIRKDASVVVKYYEQNSENALAEEITIEGKVFDEYSTEAKEIEGYTLVSTTENTEGQMTEEPIVVIYYYAKEADVVVKHIDKNTGEVIEEEVIPAKDGDIVETLPKDIPEYVLVESPEETTVQVEKEDIEVIYIYVKVSAGVIEKHIDVKSGEILETNTYEGNEGDPYKTTPKEFEGYDLVMEQYPENEEGVMTEEVIEVRYYYIRKATVKIKYVDNATGEEIVEIDEETGEEQDTTIVIEGHEGDTYVSEEKDIDGYVLIEKPVTEEIILVVEPSVDEDGNVIITTEIEVVYVYAKEADVVVEHIDINTGEKLAEDEYIEGYEGKEYTTESKEIARYVLVEEPANKEGVMKVEEVVDETTGETTLNRTTIVTYKYDKQPATILVRYINKLTGEIFEEEVVEGRLDAPYTTEAKEFEGYRFLEEEYPENATGVFTEEQIVINYYYMKISKILVYYVDSVTGELVSSEIEMDGYEGEEYVTTPIEIPGYVLVEERYPENASGKYEEEQEVVYYYYVREAKVEVTYVDKETGEELAEKVIIEGKEGDTYTTEEKEIPYYKLEEVENPEGTMKVVEKTDEETGEKILDNITEVIYKYVKQDFDMKIDKTITEVLVNGENRNIGNNKLVKAEIHRKKIADSVVNVVYQIKVTNDGEVDGSAIISDRLPEGMIFNTSDNPGWTEKGELLYRETDTLKPGESAVYEIILYWNGTKEIGTFTNQAEIVSTENVPDYEDTDSKDDKSEASIIIVTSTGIEMIVERIEFKRVVDIVILATYIVLIKKFLINRKNSK